MHASSVNKLNKEILEEQDLIQKLNEQRNRLVKQKHFLNERQSTFIQITLENLVAINPTDSLKTQGCEICKQQFKDG